MKKALCLMLSLAVLMSLAACGGSSGQAESTEPSAQETAAPDSGSDENAARSETGTDGGRILIAYFTAAENSGVDAVSSASYTTVDGAAYGVSQAVANMIADRTGGELFSIRTSVVYPADMGELIDYVAEEQADGVMPELTTHIENLSDYDTVFVGFPIWWYDMPQVMYSFFEEYDFAGKTVIPFTVHNGSRLSGTPSTIQELEPDANVIQDGFTVSMQNAAGAAEDVASWLALDIKTIKGGKTHEKNRSPFVEPRAAL